MTIHSTATPSVVRHSVWTHILLWTALPLLGGVVGFLAAMLPGWIAGLAWFPNQAKIAELSEVIGTKTTVGAIAVGITAGAVLALIACGEFITITVADDRVAITRSGEEPLEVDRHDIAGVFTDNGNLVVLGKDGSELVREASDLDDERTEAAFRSHGYTWHEQDPHAHEFTRWVDGATALSPDAHALMRARKESLEDGGDADDLRALRRELTAIGVVVKDDHKRQYWRTTTA